MLQNTSLYFHAHIDLADKHQHHGTKFAVKGFSAALRIELERQQGLLFPRLRILSERKNLISASCNLRANSLPGV